MINGTRDNLSPEFLVRKLSWILRMDELCDVAEADLRGRKCADFESTLLNVELARELAKEDDCLYEPRHFPDEFTRMHYFRTNGNCSPDYALFPTFGSSVYVMCGLPASGKNSWVQKYAYDLPVVSFDDAKEELGLKHGENDGKAAHLVIDTAKEYLRRKQDFVWNSTNLSKQMREKTLNLLYDYKAKVTIVYVEQPEDIIKSRNNKRDTTLTNEKIESMLYRWEVPTPFEAHGFEIVI
jgi:predicted kinase